MVLATIVVLIFLMTISGFNATPETADHYNLEPYPIPQRLIAQAPIQAKNDNNGVRSLENTSVADNIGAKQGDADVGAKKANRQDYRRSGGKPKKAKTEAVSVPESTEPLAVKHASKVKKGNKNAKSVLHARVDLDQALAEVDDLPQLVERLSKLWKSIVDSLATEPNHNKDLSKYAYSLAALFTLEYLKAAGNSSETYDTAFDKALENVKKARNLNATEVAAPVVRAARVAKSLVETSIDLVRLSQKENGTVKEIFKHKVNNESAHCVSAHQHAILLVKALKLLEDVNHNGAKGNILDTKSLSASNLEDRIVQDVTTVPSTTITIKAKTNVKGKKNKVVKARRNALIYHPEVKQYLNNYRRFKRNAGEDDAGSNEEEEINAGEEVNDIEIPTTTAHIAVRNAKEAKETKEVVELKPEEKDAKFDQIVDNIKNKRKSLQGLLEKASVLYQYVVSKQKAGSLNCLNLYRNPYLEK